MPKGFGPFEKALIKAKRDNPAKASAKQSEGATKRTAQAPSVVRNAIAPEGGHIPQGQTNRVVPVENINHSLKQGWDHAPSSAGGLSVPQPWVHPARHNKQ